MSAMVFTGADEREGAVGEHLGYSDWLEITQERVNSSPRRPATTSGSTSTSSGPRPVRSAAPIAHGYLTLSLASMFLPADRRGTRARAWR